MRSRNGILKFPISNFQFPIVSFLLCSLASCGLFPTEEEKEEQRLSDVMLKARVIRDWTERSETNNFGENGEPIVVGPEGAPCPHDGELMVCIDLSLEKADPSRRRNRLAYACRKENIYWSLFRGEEGGVDHLFGPFPLEE